MCELIETTTGIELVCGCFECRGMGWIEDPDDPVTQYEIPLIPCTCNPNGLDT